MFKKLVLIVAGFTLLTACGGSDPADKADKPPPAKVYAAKDLQSALPTVKQVPNGRKLLKQCPGAKDCEITEGAKQEWSVEVEIAPSSPGDLERERKFFAPQVLFFSVLELESEAKAKALAAKYRKGNASFDGSFETKAVKNGDDSYAAGVRGKGELSDAKHGEWAGYQLNKAFVLTGPSGQESEPRQDAVVTVTSGPYMITVLLGRAGYELEDDAAINLADQLLDEYLARLG